MKRLVLSGLTAILSGLVLVTAWAAAPGGIAEAASEAIGAGSITAATSIVTATTPATGTAVITAIDVHSFPDLTAYVAVNDAAGQHVANLPPDSFNLVENAAAIPADKLSAADTEVGIQVVFTLDTSAPFKARDINAVTRLDYIRQALVAFGTQAAPRMADGIDDVTLLAPEGILLTHTSQGSEFVSALTAYTSTFAGAADPLPLINQALDFASETMPRQGMPRYVVLFSNGIVVNGQAAPLNDLVTRAQSAQIAIYTVYVGPGGTSDLAGGQSLRKLAELTGGRFMVLEKPETLAPLLSYLADQRWQYQLRYRSGLAVTGQQSLTVQVQLPDGPQIVSDAATFPLRIEAPTLALSSLPAVIPFTPPASAGAVISYSVQIAIDFPDGHPRGLRSLELVADGQVVDQQTAPSVSAATLRWDLSNYQGDGVHSLAARATDELGLQAESPPVTVTLSAGAPPAQAALPMAATASAAAALPPPAFTPFLWMGIALLAVAVVVGAGGIWWWARRHAAARPETQRPARPARPPAPAKKSRGDETLPPPTKPLARPPASPSPSRPAVRLPTFTFHPPALFPKRRTAPPAKALGKAYLEVVEGGSAPREPIEILSPILRVGRDPARAEVIFQDRSMSRLHARIVESPEGVFRIYDEGSTSGTWVNFTQIPAEGGWELKSGDLINLGRIQLRFRRRAPVAGPAAAASHAQASLPGETPSADGATEPYRPLKKGPGR